jgi:hypothetical protein
VLTTVRECRAKHERILESLCAIDPDPQSPEPGPLMTLSYGLGHHRWAVEWCKQAERRLERETTSKQRRKEVESHA